MSSENFMNGASIVGLHIFFNSGAMFRIVSLSVDITPPDFGSSLEEIVPPVIMIATFGKSEALGTWHLVLGDFVSLRFWITLAVRISDSLIPIL